MKTVSQIVAIIIITLSAYLKELSAMGLYPLEGVLGTTLYIAELAVMIICTALTLFSGWIYIKDNLEFIKDC